MATSGNGESGGLARRVQDFLDRHQPKSFRLRVFEDGISHDAEWWYVPVYPDKEEVRSHEYANALAEMEESYRDQHGENVLLVPSIHDD